MPRQSVAEVRCWWAGKLRSRWVIGMFLRICIPADSNAADVWEPRNPDLDRPRDAGMQGAGSLRDAAPARCSRS
ncbi:hypothetical protein D3C81_1958030 [compost metagenome]